MANRLMVVVHGAVSVEMRGHLVCTLRPGDFFGHLSLLVEHPWVSKCTGISPEHDNAKRRPGRSISRSWNLGIDISAKQAMSSGVGVEFVSETFVECLCLARYEFAAVVATYPTEVQVWARLPYVSTLRRLLLGTGGVEGVGGVGLFFISLSRSLALKAEAEGSNRICRIYMHRD